MLCHTAQGPLTVLKCERVSMENIMQLQAHLLKIAQISPQHPLTMSFRMEQPFIATELL